MMVLVVLMTMMAMTVTLRNLNRPDKGKGKEHPGIGRHE